MRRVPRRWLLFGAGALVAGCLSPTLPLPPPTQPEVRRVGQSVYELRGSLPTAGTVYVENESSGLVFGKTVLVFYRFNVQAEPGDSMTLWYEAGASSDFYGDRSQTISFVIKDSAVVPDGGTRDGGP